MCKDTNHKETNVLFKVKLILVELLLIMLLKLQENNLFKSNNIAGTWHKA
jgi:hypothetical protein